MAASSTAMRLVESAMQGLHEVMSRRNEDAAVIEGHKVATTTHGNSTSDIFLYEENCEVPGYADPLYLTHAASFLLYIFGCIWLIIGMRVVSERYFARAIEGIIVRYKIPSSIAGATLMAAGTSAPELISSLVGVFLSASVETGAGTVMGSVVFNMTVIVGLSILVAPGQKLSCSPFDMLRDMSCYIVTIALFCGFFADGQVTLAEAWILVIAYILYVAVCANWTPVDAFLKRQVGWKPPQQLAIVEGPSEENHNHTDGRAPSFQGIVNGADAGAVEFCTTPQPNPERDGDSNWAGERSPSSNIGKLAPPSRQPSISSSNGEGNTFPKSPSISSSRVSIELRQPVPIISEILPSMPHMETQVALGFGGAMLRVSGEFQRRSGSVDVVKRELSYLETIGESAADLGELEAGMKKFEKVPDPPQGVSNQAEAGGHGGGHGHGHGHGGEEEEELTFMEEWQLVKSKGSIGSWVFFALEGNWVLWVYLTNGWLRKHQWHMTSFWVCLGWFTLQCIFMIFWLEKAGCVIGISAGVMGIVFGAAGTSIPDCLCSLYVARRGFGDMAITNVFGSNVFDILFALALPWMLGMHMSGRAIEVQNSTGLTIWMAGTLLVFILQSVATKCTYNKWHGYCYVILYLFFIIYNFINDTFHFAG